MGDGARSHTPTRPPTRVGDAGATPSQTMDTSRTFLDTGLTVTLDTAPPRHPLLLVNRLITPHPVRPVPRGEGPPDDESIRTVGGEVGVRQTNKGRPPRSGIETVVVSSCTWLTKVFRDADHPSSETSGSHSTPDKGRREAWQPTRRTPYRPSRPATPTSVVLSKRTRRV